MERPASHPYANRHEWDVVHRRTGHGAGAKARSEGVGAHDFTPAAGPQRPPDLLVDRVLDEPDGAVAHAHVDPAGVVALRRDGGGVSSLGAIGGKVEQPPLLPGTR